MSLKCDRQISGVQDHAQCPNPVKVKIVLSRITTYWDTDEEVEYLCQSHANVYLHENDVTLKELVSGGFAVVLS